jgi:hypothetical protein
MSLPSLPEQINAVVRCLRGLVCREMTSGRSAHPAQSKFALI